MVDDTSVKGMQFWHVVVAIGCVLVMAAMALSFVRPGTGTGAGTSFAFLGAKFEASDVGLTLVALALVALLIAAKDRKDTLKLLSVRKRQDRQADEIKALQIALKGILTKHETGPLEGLNSDKPVMIRYEPDLYRYLHRLDGLNFIQPNPGFGLFGIVKRHQDDEKWPYDQRTPFDLKEFVYITGDGKRYLKTLNAILEKVGGGSQAVPGL